LKSTKKLFAILTLVAFMMTLVPFAAFGAAGASVITITPATAANAYAGAAGTAWNFVVNTDAADAALAAGAVFVITLPAGFTSTGATVANGGITGSTGTPSTAVAVTTPTTSTIRVVGTTWTGANAVGDDYTIAVTAIGQNPTTPAALTANVKVYASAAAETAGTILTQGNGTMTVTPALSNRFTTTLAQDKTSVDANNTDTIKFTLFIYDQYYNPVAAGTNLRVSSSRGATDTFVQSGTYTLGAAAGNVQTVDNDATGKAEVKVKSLVAGTATIGFALAANDGAGSTIYDYLIGKSGVLLDALKFVGTKTAEFKAQSASAVNFFDITLRDRIAGAGFAPTVVTAGTEYSPAVASGTTWGAANGLDYYELSVKVTNSAGAPAADQDVQFAVDKVNVTFSASTVKSDASGIAKVKIYADKAGRYEVTYKTGNTTPKSLFLNYNAADVSKIILKSADARTIAKNTTPNWKFEVQDAQGNKIDMATAAAANAIVTSIDAVTQPSGADYKKASFTVANDADNLWVKITPNAGFDKLGDYKLRVTLSNGQYSEFSFTVKEQGAITGLKLKYPQTTLPMNTVIGTPTVTWVDANGVEKDANSAAFNADGIQFSASDYTKLTAAGITPATGVFTAVNDKNLIGDVVITAYDNSNKLTASFTVSIGRQISNMVLTAPASAAVGENSSVGVKFVDLDGKSIAVGNVAVVLNNAYAVTKPAGAVVSVDAASAFAKDLKEKGVSSLTVNSNTAGEATIFVNVGVGGNNYTGTVKVNFGAAKTVVGAKAVTLFIGATGYVQDGAAKISDVAPFIQDGRTFVAVRPLAEAFGATAGWNEATQTVTLTRSDMTLTIVIGKAEITKVVGGVTSTVKADVAAFIKDGRTVLPFRAVGEAFGATVNYDAATQAVSFVQ